MSRLHAQRRIAFFLGGLVVLAGALVALAALATTSVPVPLAGVRIESHFLYWVAGGLVVLGGMLCFASAQLALVATTLVYLTLGSFAVSYRPEGAGSVTYSRSSVDEPAGVGGASAGESRAPVANVVRRTTMGADHWFEEHLVYDERYASMGVPKGRRRYHHPDFDVVMSYDEEGWRAVPGPGASAKKAEEVWFLGCSFTFGFGVEDTESFPAVLAQEAWPDFRVRVFAHGGWGTSNAYLVLSDKLAQGPLPAAVFYGWISHHAQRNSASSAWNRKVRFAFPYIALDQGRLVKRGIISPERGDKLPSEPIDETDLSLALLREMARMCREKGVAFFVVAFEANDPVIQALRSNHDGVLLDTSRAVSLERLPRDGHPTRFWHRNIARRLAADPAISAAARRPELLQPQRVSAPPSHWWLTNDSLGGYTARLHPADGIGNQWRVDQISAKADESFKIGVLREGFATQSGREYTLRFRHRADSPRPAYVAVTQVQRAENGGRNVGLWLNLKVGTDWQTQESRFVAKLDAEEAALGIWLSQSTVPVEMADFELFDGKRDLLAEKATQGESSAGEENRANAPLEARSGK